MLMSDCGIMPHMDIRILRYFIAVAEEGNITKAAARPGTAARTACAAHCVRACALFGPKKSQRVSPARRSMGTTLPSGERNS